MSVNVWFQILFDFIRLSSVCETMVGDHGEVTLHNVYKLDPSKKHLLKNFLCYGDKKRNRCSKLEERRYKDFMGRSDL